MIQNPESNNFRFQQQTHQQNRMDKMNIFTKQLMQYKNKHLVVLYVHKLSFTKQKKSENKIMQHVLVRSYADVDNGNAIGI